MRRAEARVWGGPPSYVKMTEPTTRAALDTAFAPRKDVQLTSFVRGRIGELDVTGTALAPSPVPLWTEARIVPAPSASASAGTSTAPITSASPATPAKPTGCGACSTGGPAGNSAAFLSSGFLALGLVSRRRAGRRSRGGPP